MTKRWEARGLQDFAKDILSERNTARFEANCLRTSLAGMVESYDMLMKMPLPPTMADVIRAVFVFEVSRAREALNTYVVTERVQPEGEKDG